MLDLTEQRRLYEAATPGVWVHTTDQGCLLACNAAGGAYKDLLTFDEMDDNAMCVSVADAAFIASAHNSYLELLDTVERLEGEIRVLRMKEKCDDELCKNMEYDNTLLTAEVESLRHWRDEVRELAREIVGFRHLPDVVGGPLIYPTWEAWNRLMTLAEKESEQKC